MSFRKALEAKAKQRFWYRLFLPMFWNMFNVAAIEYLRDSEEPERFKEYWLS